MYYSFSFFCAENDLIAILYLSSVQRIIGKLFLLSSVQSRRVTGTVSLLFLVVDVS